MPLSAAHPLLAVDIENALNEAYNGAVEGEDGSKTIDMNKVHRILAQKLALAIHTYAQQAVVSTFVNTAVIGVGGGVPGPVVGTGLGAGNGKLV